MDFNKLKTDYETKKEQFKWRFNSGLRKTAKFVSENKEIVAVAIPVVYKVSKETIKGINRYSENKRDIYERDIRHWDPSTGEWYESKRKLKNTELMRMDELRKQNGWSKGEALRFMGLLRR